PSVCLPTPATTALSTLSLHDALPISRSASREVARMCGIVGYVGHRECLPILIEGLKRLEYRGYDSAGVAIHKDGQLQIVATVLRSEEHTSELQSLTNLV